MTVSLEPENQTLVFDRLKTVLQLLNRIGRKPGRVLVIRDGQLLTPDLILAPGDKILVRDVGSKG
ncbi:MAG: MoaD/ThiS family protein [Desulfovibrionales bacterium]|nr:MoaD/ThiS family protein [Desulfovibrionales bacterium]